MESIPRPEIPPQSLFPNQPGNVGYYSVTFQQAGTQSRDCTACGAETVTKH
jgi:hypothetical protein